MTTIRRAGTASVAALSGLVLTLGLAQSAAPEWTRRAGLDVWNVSAARDTLLATDRDREMLQSHAEQLHQEIEFTEHTTNRLMAGTLSLAGATDLIEPILRNRPGFDTVAEIHYPAPTFRLSVAQYLVKRVEWEMPADLSERAAISTRLEMEYALLK